MIPLPPNPWPDLPTKRPYVLAEDAEPIARFNSSASERTRIETQLLPEPFVGRLDAPVVLLALNPGFSDGDAACHANAGFRARIRRCHRQEDHDWPYYYLAPGVEGPGASWSRRVLAPLIREVGDTAVARGVVLFEYLAYHSRAFAHKRLRVPSQDFTFAAVHASLGKARAIFVTRGMDLWAARIPELVGHPRVFHTNSRQNIVISPGNAPKGWQAAVTALRQ
jgi:hypothetical protein